MPSIPQSLLWISLVVLWLFVLVPMLVSKREAVRRTSDVALATRVLNSSAAGRLLKRRGGPAAGHRSDPDWQPEEDEYDELDDVDSDETEEMPLTREPIIRAAPTVRMADGQPVTEVEPVADEDIDDEAEFETEDDEDDDDLEDSDEGDTVDAVVDDEDEDDQYEYVDDTSGIPVADESAATVSYASSRRHRYDPDAAAAQIARKYTSRKRVLMVMALMLVASAATAFLLTPTAWWVCGSIGTVTVLYLGYLRRQTRIEERLHRRRVQRMARSRLGVENTYDQEFDVVPSRLRRPGAVVLEIDDEDPIFEHLDYAPYARDYGWHHDLPRAVGQ
jgi:hypothetical protein